jgi:hypothetical protein
VIEPLNPPDDVTDFVAFTAGVAASTAFVQRSTTIECHPLEPVHVVVTVIVPGDPVTTHV